MKDQELMDAITVLLDDGFSVGQVAEKTGVSVEIIKAWLEALGDRLRIRERA